MKFGTFGLDLESHQGHQRSRHQKGLFSNHKLAFDAYSLNIKVILSDYKELNREIWYVWP